jgi:hypothetical protein
MRLQVLLDRLWDRSRTYFYSDKALIKITSRLLFSSLLATLVIFVSNAIADVIVPPVDTEEIVVQVEPTVQASPEPTVQASPEPTMIAPDPISAEATPEPSVSQNSEDSATPSSSPSASAEPKIVYLPEVQPTMRIFMPISIGVDPRARSSFLPRINFSGSNFVVACLYGNGLKIDAGILHATDDRQVPERKGSQPAKFDTFEVLGDRTSNLIIAGQENQVKNFLNSGNGMFVYTSGPGISGRSVSLALTGLLEPKLKPEFCGAARSSAYSVFRTIGIEINTKGGAGKLK